MGGNALTEMGARRYQRREYLELRNKVIASLYQAIPLKKFTEIPSYFSKESFGDLDILCLPLVNSDYLEILDLSGKKGCSLNADVLSVLWEELQVDIIPMSEENWVTALTYYSYNDLGNLMGKIFRKLGLKYGHRGLSLDMTDGTNKYSELLISKDPERIFKFIGLDYETFLKGFCDLEDIFDYVIGSLYFSPEVFLYENLRSKDRVRDAKRNTYREFLKYIEGKPSNAIYENIGDNCLPLIFQSFPEAEAKYSDLKLQHEKTLLAGEKLNGEKIKAWTGLTDKPLGVFMKRLRETHGEFPQWVLEHTDKELLKIVMREFTIHLYGNRY